MLAKTPVKKTTENAHRTKGLQTSGLKPAKKTAKKTQQGLFVIEPSGDDVKVTKPKVEVKVW